MEKVLGTVGAPAIVAVALLMAWRSDLLADTSTATTKPFSFARVQLCWWTVIIAAGYVLACGWQGTVLKLTQGAVVLLGISATTTAGGRLIDSADASGTAPARHQDRESRGFLNDILSDDQGVSIHRFQSVLFNLIFGGVYVVHLLKHLSGPDTFLDLGAEQLSLIGVSSATYLGVKLGENKTVETSAASDELLDLHGGPVG